MTMDWRETTLGEICDQVDGIIQTGPFGSQLHESDYSQEGIPVVMPKDIIEGRIETEGIARVAPEHVERLSRHKLKPGEIVYGRRGDIGRQALIRQPQAGWLCGTGCLRLSLGDSVIEPLFLHYYLRQQDVIDWIANQAIGATLPNLNTGILRSVPVRFPPLPIQRSVASVLSAYDDLIENNTRRIQILERMAQALYREWFVNFRFPDHAKVKLVDSPLGQIPQGWLVTRIGDVIETLGGGTPSTKNPAYWDNGTINWYSPSDLTAAGALFVAESSRKITELGLRESNAKLFPANCVMMTSRATIGVVAINSTPATTNQGFMTCIPNTQLCAYHIVEWIKQNMELIIGVASGATFKEISRGEFRDLSIVLPPKGVEREYSSTVDPMYQEIRVLLAKNIKLRRTRDLLLPKLISGALDVSKLDIEAGSVTP